MFISRYLFLCLHLEINSERLFNNVPGFAWIIYSFSARHRPQVFDPHLYGVDCLTRLHRMLNILHLDLS